MKRQDKAARIQAILDERFPKPPIPLDHDDPFTLLVAVLLFWLWIRYTGLIHNL